MEVNGKAEQWVAIGAYRRALLRRCAGYREANCPLCESRVERFAAEGPTETDRADLDLRIRRWVSAAVRRYRGRCERHRKKLEAARLYEAAKEEMLTPTEPIALQGGE